MSDQVFYLFSAVLLGLVIGALIMYFASGKNSNSAKTAELEKKLKIYQEDVVQHFEKTADLVDDLTESYKKVFDHLGSSAKELMTDEQLQLQMEKRQGKKVTLEFLPLTSVASGEVPDEELFEELVEEIESNDANDHDQDYKHEKNDSSEEYSQEELTKDEANNAEDENSYT